MPAIRLSTRRRRSSHAIFTPAKPGVYGVVQPRPVTFAPNVTPITYVETDDDEFLSSPPSPQSSSQHHHTTTTTTTLFPPSSTPAPPPARKRCPPGKRRSQGYIPRPPNAFMLFRADFVRQKHVPGSIETNHGSLSKIIGNCWRQLPLDEKRIWEIKAKQEKANHKAQFPDYRFRPVHNKSKNKLKASSSSTTAPTTSNSSSSDNNLDGTSQEEEERRCEQVAQLLLEGMKGEDLARAVKDLDRVREEAAAASTSRTQPTTTSFDLAMPIPMSSFQNPFGFGEFGFGNSSLALPPSAAAYHRRSSSVPLPLPNSSDFFLPSFNDYSAPQTLDMASIALPSVPFMSHSHTLTRPSSPVNNISRQRTLLGHRRASSAQPVFRRSWAIPFYSTSNTFTTGGGTGTSFSNTDMSGFDWSSMNMNMNPNIQVERDESPLPEVDLELFNGFSFDESVVDSSTASSMAVSTSMASSSSSSSSSDRNSPWLETPAHSHARMHPHRPSPAIAPHDLPPLDMSSDMNWHGPPTTTTASTSSTSISSAFPSPSLPVPAPDATTTTTTGKSFDIGIDFGLGLDMNAMGVDYGYDMSMGFSDMGYNHHHHHHPEGGVGNEMGMVVGMPLTEMDTMWNVSQAQQA